MVGWNVLHGRGGGNGDNMATYLSLLPTALNYILITQKPLTSKSILPNSSSMPWPFLPSLEESYFLTNLSHCHKEWVTLLRGTDFRVRN